MDMEIARSSLGAVVGPVVGLARVLLGAGASVFGLSLPLWGCCLWISEPIVHWRSGVCSWARVVLALAPVLVLCWLPPGLGFLHGRWYNGGGE